MSLFDQRPALGAVGVAVGGDHLLVDVPGHLDRGVLVGREQRLELAFLLVGEQVDAGVQGAAGSGSPVRPR